jgi:hypothetical protein
LPGLLPLAWDVPFEPPVRLFAHVVAVETATQESEVVSVPRPDDQVAHLEAPVVRWQFDESETFDAVWTRIAGDAPVIEVPRWTEIADQERFVALGGLSCPL